MNAKKPLFDALKGTDYSYSSDTADEATFATFRTVSIQITQAGVAIIVPSRSPKSLIQAIISTELPKTVEAARKLITGKTLSATMVSSEPGVEGNMPLTMTLYGNE